MANQARILKNRKITHEPDWLKGKIGGRYAATPTHHDQTCDDGLADLPVQQSDVLKPLYMDIVEHGLDYAYTHYGSDIPWVKSMQESVMITKTQTENPRDVIIVGAGMAGLAAAYELKEAGHRVHILEMQKRVGGRVKTFGEKDGFARGLYVDAGAMRLPNEPCATKTHFLTDYYAKTKFDLDLVEFKNSDNNAFVKFYNMDPITHEEWNGDDRGYANFCSTWPDWNSKVHETRPDIKNIGEYYSATSKIVTDQLRSKLVGDHTIDEEAEIWGKWIDNWCRFSLNGFLRSKVSEVLSKLDDDYQDIDTCELEKLIPWPEEAITAYSVYNYTEQLDQSLVQYLRDELGEWWSDNMHHINGGMSKLPEKFYDHLKEDITFNVTINEIVYTATEAEKKVVVQGYYSTSGQPCEFEGYAVIVTTPLHIIRQMKIVNAEDNTPPFPSLFYQALEDIWYGPSTKIMIQTKTRFWDTGPKPIKGGFSKTNLPIGQLHYPTSTECETDISDRQGILLIYTWKSEALQFGALHPQIAVREAVRQIQEIHPDIDMNDQFEVGAVEAWYNEPSAQGAYVLLKPQQYHNVARLMQYPFLNIFFAGEGISFAAGWIQGALESGLRAAYQFYSRNEEDELHCIEVQQN